MKCWFKAAMLALMLLFPITGLAKYQDGLWCWSENRWFFDYGAEIRAGEMTPYLEVQKLNQRDKRFRIYDNVDQAARDAVRVCRGELEFDIFQLRYDLVKMKTNQFVREP